MRNRLAARPRGIDVGASGRVEDGKGAGRQALGRDVDVGAVSRRGGGEEEGLGEGPGAKVVGDGGVEGWHFWGGGNGGGKKMGLR